MYVIKNKTTGMYFSNWVKDYEGTEEEVWNTDDPWKYGRLCDAQFVLANMGWQATAEVVELED